MEEAGRWKSTGKQYNDRQRDCVRNSAINLVATQKRKYSEQSIAASASRIQTDINHCSNRGVESSFLDKKRGLVDWSTRMPSV